MGLLYFNDKRYIFLRDLLWISPWIKSISNELDITIHVITSQLSGHCDVIGNRLWRHQQNENWASEARERCVKIIVFIGIYGSVMSCKKWNNVCTLPTNCFCTHSSVILVLFPSLLRDSGNKHQNNPFVSTITVPHSSNLHTLFFIFSTVIICRLIVFSWQVLNARLEQLYMAKIFLTLNALLTPRKC